MKKPEFKSVYLVVDVFVEEGGQPAYFDNLTAKSNIGGVALRANKMLPVSLKEREAFELTSTAGKRLALDVYSGSSAEEIVRAVFVTHGFEEYVELIRKLIDEYGFWPPPDWEEEDYFWRTEISGD